MRHEDISHRSRKKTPLDQGRGPPFGDAWSRFCLQQIRFLRHFVSGRGVSADPEKLEAIRCCPVPTNLKEVQWFLGPASWYHTFVPDFSKTAQPFNDLKKKARAFIWSQTRQHVCDQPKSFLSLLPVLGHPNPEFRCYLDRCK